MSITHLSSRAGSIKAAKSISRAQFFSAEELGVTEDELAYLAYVDGVEAAFA